MRSTAVAIYLSCLLGSIQSAPCVPADTCFTSKGGRSSSALDSSWSASCNPSSPRVTKTVYNGNTECVNNNNGNAVTTTLNNNGNTGSFSGTLLTGLTVTGSSSGAVGTDYLQGTNCPNLASSSDACTEYVVFRRYGNSAYVEGTESLPYLDIGTDCVSKGSQYDEFVSPKGCFRIDAAGSNYFSCNSTHFWWTHYSGTDCTGTVETAQSDMFEHGNCGHFVEYTHCNNGETICPGDPDAVIDEWYYYFEIECGCTDTCSGSPSSNPAATPSPTSSTPVASPVATPAPTTANPTDSNGTGRPTTANPTVPPQSTSTPTTTSSGAGRVETACNMVLIMLLISKML